MAIEFLVTTDKRLLNRGQEVDICLEGKTFPDLMLRLYSSMYSEYPAWRVEVFDDNWLAFKEVPELFEALADYNSDGDSQSLTLDEMRALLKRLGYKEAHYDYEGV